MRTIGLPAARQMLRALRAMHLALAVPGAEGLPGRLAAAERLPRPTDLARFAAEAAAFIADARAVAALPDAAPDLRAVRAAWGCWPRPGAQRLTSSTNPVACQSGKTPRKEAR
jgi:hypothetical protein